MPKQYSRESGMIRMIVLKSVFLWALALSSAVLALERPLSKNADVDPLLIAPETVVSAEDGEIVPFQEVDELYRLPKTSIPSHYDIQLGTSIHSGDRNFQGTVKIDLEVKEETKEIVLHQRGLTITAVTLNSLPGNAELPLDTEFPMGKYEATYEQLRVISQSALVPGKYSLTITFSGRLANNEDGFYVSSYVDDSGRTRYLATTQFESTSARMAFPCFDEPALKATFKITIIHDASYSAYSNMQGKKNVVGENAITQFDTTTKMSTYLLAFVVSDFEFKGNNLHSTFARPNAIEEVAFGQEAGVKILQALNEHLGINYYNHMPEMKQFAIPDFAAGAMENWGLVTYREQYLLFNPVLSTYRTKTNIATIIAHEYGHQWFGNLVSPEWWEYIWLNEGFATVYEYLGAHLAYPEENYWEMFNPFVIQAAMVPDGLESTRPMTWNADTPSSISRLFDRVAYPKSGSVLNMIRHIVGEENWKDGLNRYLKARELDSANVEHLHEGLQAAIEGKGVLPNGVTIKQIMDTWTTEKGYPVVSVRRSYDTGDIILSQERFISDRKVPNDNVWMIPYNFVRQSTPDFSDVHTYSWMSTKAARISTNVPANEWVIFNKQQVGYYRVNYDEQNWKLITNALLTNHASIHRLNRAQLIDDAYWLARSGRLDIDIFMKLFTYLKNERDFAPWTAANNVLSYYNGKFRGTPAYHDFLILVDDLIGQIYPTLAVDSVDENEPLLDKYVKQTISNWACTAGYKDCLERTANALTKEIADKVLVHPDIASVVYCHGLRNAGETEFRYLYSRIYSTQDWAFRTMIIDSLGCSQNKQFLKDFLQTALGTVEINYKSSERSRVVQSVYSGGRAGVEALAEFLMDQNMVNDFIARLGINALNSAVSNIAARTNSLEELATLNNLLSSLGSQITPATANAALATAQSNIDWHLSQEGLLTTNFIEDYASSIEPETTTVPSPTTTPAPGTTPSPGSTTLAPTTTEDPDGAAGSIAVSFALLVGAVFVSLLN